MCMRSHSGEVKTSVGRVQTRRGVVTLTTAFLTALVGFGGIGAVIAYETATQLLDGIHETLSNVSVDQSASRLPTPTLVPTPTTEQSVLQVRPMPTVGVTRSDDVHIGNGNAGNPGSGDE